MPITARTAPVTAEIPRKGKYAANLYRADSGSLSAFAAYTPFAGLTYL